MITRLPWIATIVTPITVKPFPGDFRPTPILARVVMPMITNKVKDLIVISAMTRIARAVVVIVYPIEIGIDESARPFNNFIASWFGIIEWFLSVE